MTVKLLCVDDNRLVLRCVARCAVNFAWLDVSTASSARMALELVEQHGPFDVIISDYHMPGMNGIDLLRRLKEWYPESLRFLQSSSAEMSDVSKAIEEGIVSRFFPKPIKVVDINDMLNGACAQVMHAPHQ